MCSPSTVCSALLTVSFLRQDLLHSSSFASTHDSLPFGALLPYASTMTSLCWKLQNCRRTPMRLLLCRIVGPKLAPLGAPRGISTGAPDLSQQQELRWKSRCYVQPCFHAGKSLPAQIQSAAKPAFRKSELVEVASEANTRRCLKNRFWKSTRLVHET